MRNQLLGFNDMKLAWTGAIMLVCAFSQWASGQNAEVENIRAHAEKGEADAQNTLGLAYKGGRGVPQDYTQAAQWFQKAADQGNAVAQRNLGSLYLEGQGVKQD